MAAARRCCGEARELRRGQTQFAGIVATRESRGEMRGTGRDSRGSWQRKKRAAGTALARQGFGRDVGEVEAGKYDARWPHVVAVANREDSARRVSGAARMGRRRQTCCRPDSHRRQSPARRRPASRLRVFPEKRRLAGRKWYPARRRLVGGRWSPARRRSAGYQRWGCWQGGGRTATTREEEAGRPEVAHGKEEDGRLPEVVSGKEKAGWPIGTGKGDGRAAEVVERVAAAWRRRRFDMVLCLLLSAISLVPK